VYVASIPVLLSAVLISAVGANAQNARPSIRIGVFDSRAIALAWAHSDDGGSAVKQLMAEYEKSKSAQDEKRMKELEQEGEWQQVRLHQMGFSTGPVGDILAKVKDQVAEIGRQERVVAIVSKWEMPYSGEGVEVVDLTPQLVKLFHPTAQVLTMIEQMKNQPPVPFAKLPLDPKM
jgi:hypothetical protein